MKPINGPSTLKNTPQPFGARSFHKRPAGAVKTAYFKQFAGFRPLAMRPAPGRHFHLLLPTEKPDFTPADQEWIAQLVTQQLSWEDW